MDDPYPDDLLPSIERYLAGDRARPRGLDLYPGVFAAGSFFPLQRTRELAAMMRSAREVNPRVVMEIGCDKGGGLYHWVKCLPTVERVVACEVRGTPYRGLFERAFPEVDFLWVEGSSYDPASVARVRDWLHGDPIDCLFVDGDKGMFLADFDAYLPLCRRPGGRVYLHDVCDPAPAEAWAEVVRRGHPTSLICDRSEGVEAVARAARGEPAGTAYEAWLRHWGGQSCTVGVVRLD